MKYMTFELNEKEIFFKKIYENGGEEMLNSPMTFCEYLEIEKSKKRYYEENESYHINISVNHPGNTIKDVVVYGECIEIVRHNRYSYPILHNHDYIELIYVHSGTCTHFIESQVINMKEGDICILAPNAMHAISAVHDDDIIINIMMSRKLFNIEFLRMLKDDINLSKFLKNILYNKQVSPYIIFPTDKDKWINKTFLDICYESENRDYLYNESIATYVKQLFIYLIRNYNSRGILSKPLDSCQYNNIMSVIQYISINYNNVSLKEIAQFFGYNEIYLGQMIRKYTNKSFCTIVSELQMKNASILLRESTLSVTEIGYEVGCYDASHFNKKFKKIYGLTPKQYRAKNKKIED